MLRTGSMWRAAALLLLAALPACRGEEASSRPLTVALRSKRPLLPDLHPLSYRGGFTAKTCLYETLVRRDEQGRIVPALAQSWLIEDEGRVLVLKLREDARFHDGTPVDAEAVRLHLKSWIGLPEHGWLRSSERVREITTLSVRELRIRFSEPTAFLPDLCAINPCAVRAPSSLDSDGVYFRPVGSGPYQLDSSRSDDRNLYLTGSAGTGPESFFFRLFPSVDEAFEALLNGEVDLLVDGWTRLVPRRRIPEIGNRFELSSGPGSVVVYLSFRLEQGPTAELAVRRRIRSVIDRGRLIDEVEAGYATPCFAWAAPSVKIWPASRIEESADSGGAPSLTQPLRLLADDQSELGHALAAQLSAAGLATELMEGTPEELTPALESGAYDLRIESTWGVPYDPYISLTARFLPPPEQETAAAVRFFGVDQELTRLVDQATRTADPNDLPAVYQQIQQRIDRHVSLIPLYVPKRLCVIRSEFRPPRLDHDLYRLDLR